jgi:tetratricopeptide (TPR) repeat protein
VPELYNILGTVLTGQSKLDEAVDCYRRVIKFKPDAAGAYVNLGNVYQRLNQLDEAVTSFQQALKLNPNIAQAHNNLGAALAAQGRFAEAVVSYRQALALKPDYAQALNNLGNALRDLGELDDARACFQRALEISPDNAETLYNLHTLLLEPGDLSPAIRCLENAVQLQPANTHHRLYLGVVLDYAGNTDEADIHFNEVQQHGSALDRARLDAWNYIKTANATPPKMVGSYLEAFRLGMQAARDSGLILEFGVRFGTTIRQIAGLVEQQVYGFDSFEGLPEAWHHEQKGSYTTQGRLPQVPDNVILHKGWFADTLPEFVKIHNDPVRFMNIDCDLYSATKTILDALASQIVSGTVIVFDEYIGNEHWREDEFKAFQEAVNTYGWNYEYLAFSLFTKQVVVRML